MRSFVNYCAAALFETEMQILRRTLFFSFLVAAKKEKRLGFHSVEI